ncbi:hypothetical protein Are01nite_88540 [Actinoplanes regularis]|nr:hypothetical protein Are01nite_88540 [Actinoplanes regularis]
MLDLDLHDAVTERATQLHADAHRILSVACVQRMAPLLVRSARENELRRPLLPIADEGLTVAWMLCLGQNIDPADVAARLRAYAPEDADDKILDVDSSVLAFVRDLPDLFDQPRLFISSVFNLMSSYRDWHRQVADYGSGPLFEIAALLREVEWLEDAAVTPELVDRIREHAIWAGKHLVAIVEDWSR